MKKNILCVTCGSKEYKEISKNKIKRNDPCPCGSGEKYKKCCGKYSEAQKIIKKEVDRKKILKEVEEIRSEKKKIVVSGVNITRNLFKKYKKEYVEERTKK